MFEFVKSKMKISWRARRLLPVWSAWAALPSLPAELHTPAERRGRPPLAGRAVVEILAFGRAGE